MRTLTPSTFTIAALYQSIKGKNIIYVLILAKKSSLLSSHTQISFNQYALLYFWDTLAFSFYLPVAQGLLSLLFPVFFLFFSLLTLFLSLCVITKWAIDLSHVAFKGLTVYNCSRPTVQFSVESWCLKLTEQWGKSLRGDVWFTVDCVIGCTLCGGQWDEQSVQAPGKGFLSDY